MGIKKWFKGAVLALGITAAGGVIPNSSNNIAIYDSLNSSNYLETREVASDLSRLEALSQKKEMSQREREDAQNLIRKIRFSIESDNVKDEELSKKVIDLVEVYNNRLNKVVSKD